MKPVNFGIDLGTTNSLIAHFSDGTTSVFANPIGHKRTLASVVAFRKERILIGDKAREYLLKDAVNVFGGFKRKMGTDEKYYVVNIDENITPVQLSSLVLKELLGFVHLDNKPEAAVITIPASFDTMQSTATRNAGLEAGLEEVFLLQEPIAASLAYFNTMPNETHDGHWLVYDLGGGTFDIALVKIENGELNVIDHEGNNFLGGLDFDYQIVSKIIVPEIEAVSGFQNFESALTEPYGSYEKLYFELLYKAEELKKELSVHYQTQIEFSTTIEEKSYDFDLTITVAQFNELIAPQIQQTINMLQQVLQRNNLNPNQINRLVLVGGSTYIPYVKTAIFDATGIATDSNIDATLAVAMGAAYYAANKYYNPKEHSTIRVTNDVDALLQNIATSETMEADSIPLDIAFTLSYSKMSKESEEVLLVKAEGLLPLYYYRVSRGDGGFDTGLVPIKSKFTEFLPLLAGIVNMFQFKVYDDAQRELIQYEQTITITQGQYNISGQPLPKDICVEVDDKENNTTKLELIFEKNSVLPLKKTIYREVSKTIKKGSEERIIINILEGDRYARPLSNLTIGCVEICGKDLNSDLIKGSDIELQLFINDNRELSTTVFLVMTQQEFKNVFAIAEKHISITRLKEQFYDLEQEIRRTLKDLDYTENKNWEQQANELYQELSGYKSDLEKIKDNDRSDKKYIIAEAISRISQAFDKIGGDDRLQTLIDEYLDAKEYIEQQLPYSNYEKDRMQTRFNQLINNESQLLRTRNHSLLIKTIDRLNKLGWDVLYNTNSYLIVRFEQIKILKPTDFTNHNAAQSIIKMADKALEQERFAEFRQHVYNLTHLLVYEQEYLPNTDFKGTGIG